MATCDLGYSHDDAVPEPEPEPVVVNPGPNENDVRIAEIEAAASIERGKQWADEEKLELAAEVESLRGEIRGMREVLDRLSPPEPDPAPPAPAPVVVADAGGSGEDVPPPPETGSGKPRKSDSGFWSGYATS